ncbi:MAG: hypothetical protein E6I18_10545 [Chloroflexi bacterium]|nr:MAG: hypothetical protein E6I18_10545 [Chloroflexota bacterium]
MNVVMLIGGSIATLGVLTICYGLWTAMMGVTRTGRLPAGSREIQVRGMAITVFGIGVMTLSAGLLVTDVLGALVCAQGAAMFFFAGRLTGTP